MVSTACATTIEGVSWRLGYDLICLSGPRDQDALEQLVAGTPFAKQRTVLTGCGATPRAQTSFH